MKKNAIGILLALTFSAAAQANSFSNDYFTITYDDSFWDGANISWNAKTGTLSFGNLVEKWGLVASATSKQDITKSDYTGKDWSNMLTVTAKSGNVLSSVETGIKGSVAAGVGSENGYAGSSAWVNTYWTLPNKESNANSSASAYSSYSNGRYDASGVASFNGNSGEGPAVASMMADQSFAASTGANTTATLNWLGAGVAADVYGKGSSARASINQMSFTVVTAPVPEPETYAMFLAGLGVIGAVARRRKQA